MRKPELLNYFVSLIDWINWMLDLMLSAVSFIQGN